MVYTFLIPVWRYVSKGWRKFIFWCWEWWTYKIFLLFSLNMSTHCYKKLANLCNWNRLYVSVICFYGICYVLFVPFILITLRWQFFLNAIVYSHLFQIFQTTTTIKNLYVQPCIEFIYFWPVKFERRFSQIQIFLYYFSVEIYIFARSCSLGKNLSSCTNASNCQRWFELFFH